MSEQYRDRTEHIRQWSDLKRAFSRVFSESRSPYLFRGQADADWSLDPSLLRRTSRSGKQTTREKLVEVETKAKEEFSSQAHLHLDDSIVRQAHTDEDWWGLMQQYRAPTRLLDWTRSPYVAAYFAANELFDRPGCIWFFCLDKLSEVMQKIPGGQSLTTPRIIAHKFILPTNRMVAQQGMSTFSSDPTADHAAVLDEHMPRNCVPRAFHRYTFPPEQKPHILHELRQMNITAATLLPGIDGLGESIAELITVGMAGL